MESFSENALLTLQNKGKESMAQALLNVWCMDVSLDSATFAMNLAERWPDLVADNPSTFASASRSDDDRAKVVAHQAVKHPSPPEIFAATKGLIESLREELKHYGEMLALLDQQRQLVLQQQTFFLSATVQSVNTQAKILADVRQEREQRQRHLAQRLALPEDAAFTILTPRLPADYQPLVDALVSENHELLARVQQRARQNHLLLSDCAELMQQFIHSIFPATSR